MRKHQQQQLLELIKTLDEAHAEILHLYTSQKTQAVVGLLSNCQDVAVHIIDFIEPLEGEGTKTVSLLEEYYTLVYNISVDINNSNSDIEFYKKLQELLFDIESSIKNDFKPNKFEIVFFPYKASMFDSMESVWSAAKDDPQCDAYVIPIPYVDRTSKGVAGQFHYEGYQYPDYVPIIDWQKYNIEERHPDVIVIHTPYDDGNNVTSVHPDFYSNRLKSFTDLLVYIPYYVVSDDISEDFCLSSGVLHADKVIVQSEKVRATYIQAFNKFERENRCVGMFGRAEEKILALGSPKFDKVINSKPEDFTLPDDWKKLIERPDGSRKKIMLYNTTVGSILMGNSQYLKKLKYVFDIFRDRDDIILWWRPHPLSNATYESMRPHLANEYKHIVTDYKQEAFGIYDDTADLHRALCLSSFFYGDASSLMPLYQCMHKPVMVQNVDVCGVDNGSHNLSIRSICDTGEYLWFTTFLFNALFRMNKKTWEPEYICSFNNEGAFNFWLYSCTFHYENRLFFTPLSARAIAVYSIATESLQYIPLPLPNINNNLRTRYNDKKKFSKILRHGNFLYFIPLTFPGILEYNLLSNSFTIIDKWLNLLNGLVIDPELLYFNNAILNEEYECLALPFGNTNAVMTLDLNTKATVLHTIDKEKHGYIDILYVDNTYWLLAIYKPALVSWDIKNDVFVEYNIDLEGITSNVPNLFQRIVISNNSLFLVPFKFNRIVKFDLSNHSFSYAEDFDTAKLTGNVLNEVNKEDYYYLYTNIRNKIYINTKQNNHFIEYDPLNGSIRDEGIKVTKTPDLENLREFLTKRQSCALDTAINCTFIENPYATQLDTLIEIITQPDSTPWLDYLTEKQTELRKSEISNSNGKAGVKIFELIKKTAIG